MTDKVLIAGPDTMLQELYDWVAVTEVESVAYVMRRALHLLGRMVESGIDPHREVQPAPGCPFGVLLPETSMRWLKAASEAVGLDRSKTCRLAFEWYKEVAQAQLNGGPFVLRGRHGEVDCTRLLLP